MTFSAPARLSALIAVLILLASSALAQPPERPRASREGNRANRPAPRAEAPASASTAVPADALTVSAADGYTTPIEFKMNNAELNTIIQFITEHTGKPVVKGQSVNARLTVSSREKIPPYEALDLIYDSLRLENIIVIETEDQIHIVPAKDAAKFDISTFSDELPPEVARQKGRLIRKIIPLQNVRAPAMMTYIQPLLGEYASIAADERTNKLLITDTVRNIERYERILSELDIVGFDDVEVRIVDLVHGDAEQLAQILSQTVGEQAQGRRQQQAQPGQPPAAQAPTIILADTRTNSLIVAAPLERVNSVLDLVKRLDVPKADEVAVNVVTVKYADAPEIARAVNDIFRRFPGGSAQTDRIEVRDTGRNNALLVLASQDNFELVKSVIEALDTEDAQKRETRRYELKHLDAEETAQELTNLYGDVSESNRNPYFFYWGDTGGSDEEVKFVPITRSNAVLVIAPPQEFTLIESLIKEIDVPVNTEEVLPKFYRLGNAKASEVVETLEAVFNEEDDQSFSWWAEPEDKKQVGRLTGKVRFTSDDNTNTVIAVTNTAANYEVIDQVIQQLDQAFPELANTTIVQLRHANAVRLANTLNSLFGRPTQAQRPQREGNQENNEEEENTDEEYYGFWWGGESQRQDVRPISNLIEQVRFVPDPRTNSLLVTTAAQNFLTIRNLIEELDRKEPQVLIKVRILEVGRNRDQRLGLRWTPDPSIYSPDDFDNAIRAANSLEFLDSFGVENDASPISVSRESGTRTFTQEIGNGENIISSTVNLDLLLQLLIRNLDAEILIAPTIYTSNNEPGHLFVGQNIPRLTGSQLTDTGTRNDTFENEDIGITLDILPHISREGQVVLNVELVTAQTTGQTRFGSDVLQKREYDTQVSVSSHETVVLGGIRLETEINTIRKFPILGDIPLINPLFRNTVKTDQVTDLYAFITPVIIATDEEAQAARLEIQESIGGEKWQRQRAEDLEDGEEDPLPE